MISPRPWSFGYDHDQNGAIVDAHGNVMLLCRSSIDYDEAEHAVACVNAIHAAGIDPADLPKLTAEVERLRKNIERLEEKLAENEVEGVCRMCGKRFPSSSW